MMHDYHDSIDLYCERTDAGFWAEPVNALTNLAFLVSAALLARDWVATFRGRPGDGWDRLLLVALVAAIGVGSGLFHTFARRWAELADVLPIAAFISLYLLVFLKRVAGLGWGATAVWFAAYHLANAGVKQALPADFLNASVYYLPSWSALVVMAAWLGWRQHPRWRLYTWAATLFLVSLVFRTVDLALCVAWPQGTHFLWHLFNAGLLWLLVRGVMDAPAQDSRAG